MRSQHVRLPACAFVDMSQRNESFSCSVSFYCGHTRSVSRGLFLIHYTRIHAWTTQCKLFHYRLQFKLARAHDIRLDVQDHPEQLQHSQQKAQELQPPATGTAAAAFTATATATAADAVPATATATAADAVPATATATAADAVTATATAADATATATVAALPAVAPTGTSSTAPAVRDPDGVYADPALSIDVWHVIPFSLVYTSTKGRTVCCL
jgi:hypothetical protein